MVRAARGQRRSPLYGVAHAASDPLPSVVPSPPRPTFPAGAVPTADAPPPSPPPPPLAADDSALESHSAEIIGSSVASKTSLPKWFSSTRCTAGVNHTSPGGVEETTPSEPPPPPAPLTSQRTEASEGTEPADLTTGTGATSTTHITTTRAYASPPSPALAAFYVDDA